MLSKLKCGSLEKFIYYYPSGSLLRELDEELQNGQDCSHCAPDCSRLRYSASVSLVRYSHLYNKDKIFKNIFTKNRTLINSTTIRLFFASEHQSIYLVEVNSRWFEIFGRLNLIFRSEPQIKLSSEWWALVGASLVAVAELAYHCTLRWAHHYRRRAGVAPSARARVIT